MNFLTGMFQASMNVELETAMRLIAGTVWVAPLIGVFILAVCCTKEALKLLK
jgi:hypothetical protein